MNKILDSLKQELTELEKARDVLAYSYDKCSTPGVRADLSNEELESFEALTSRFARLSDILIQKNIQTLRFIGFGGPWNYQGQD